jgi:hypothetical protein
MVREGGQAKGRTEGAGGQARIGAAAGKVCRPGGHVGCHIMTELAFRAVVAIAHREVETQLRAYLLLPLLHE